MAQEMTAQAQEKEVQGQGTLGSGSDFAGFEDFLRRHQQEIGAADAPQQAQTQAQPPQQNNQQQQAEQSEQQPQTQETPVDTSENPDASSAQDAFKDVKPGDKYTDGNGQNWEWAVFEYEVVPEDVKDGMVDELSAEEEVEGEEEDDGNAQEGDEETELSDEEALNRGLDIALSVLKEEDGDETGADNEESDAVAEDEAIRLVMDACNEVLGVENPQAVAQDGRYTDPRDLTEKQDGYSVKRWKDAPLYLRKKGLVKPMEGGRFWVDSYLPKQNKSAKEKARLSHRRPVAATWKDCRAKDKSKCPFHGAAYMTDQLAAIIKGNGLTPGKYGVIMDDSEETESGDKKKKAVKYRLLFSVPEGTSTDVQNKIAKDFFAKNPSIVLSMTTMYRDDVNDNTVFSVRGSEYIDDDLPIDAPDIGDYEERHDTGTEGSYGERDKAKGAMSWAKVDEQPLWRYFNMLSERPTNIVELNEDVLRYAKQFPEVLSEELSLEKIQAAYDAFKKANAKKKGLQAFLAHGMMVDKAEALAKAAEMGLEKEGKDYYEAADNIYKMGSDVFNAVQEHAFDSMMTIRKEGMSLPEYWKVTDEKNGGNQTLYFGSEFKGGKEGFPLKGLPKAVAPIIQDALNSYKSEWMSANKGWDYVRLGCEMREPLMVFRGMAIMKAHIDNARDMMEAIGAVQDDFLNHASPKWKEKHGFKVADKKNVKPSEKPVDKPKEENKKTENVETASAKEPEKGSLETQEVKDVEVPKETESSGTTTGGQKLTPEQMKVCEEAAKKDKNINALNARRRKMFKAYGADSDEYKEADRKAVEALEVFAKKWYKDQSGSSSAETPSAQVAKTGIDIVKGMKIPDKPTLESATALNKQFAALEKKLRGLTKVFTSQTPDSQDGKAAEEEMKGIKAELDTLVKSAKGKGYQWTKDMSKYGEDGPSDKRPFDVPTNFRISGIKGEDGKTVNVPYTAPASKEIDMPESKEPAESTTEESAKGKTKETKPSKPKMSVADSIKAFEEFNEKIGEVADGNSIKDLMEVYGYEMMPVSRGGKTHHLLVKKDANSRSGVDTSKPYYILDGLYEKYKLGKDGASMENFIDALTNYSRKAKKEREL